MDEEWFMHLENGKLSVSQRAFKYVNCFIQCLNKILTDEKQMQFLNYLTSLILYLIPEYKFNIFNNKKAN